MIPGEYTPTGPKCMIKIGDGARAGRCLDVESEHTRPGGLLNVYPCYTRWHQLFSFGNGTIAPRGSIHASLPLHMVRQLESKETEVHGHLCLGVKGRGDMDESTWKEEEDEEEGKKDEEEEEKGLRPWERPDADVYPSGKKSLQLWSGEQLQTTPCSNEGSVIEFYYVPFIIESYEDQEMAVDASASSLGNGENAEAPTETDEEL